MVKITYSNYEIEAQNYSSAHIYCNDYIIHKIRTQLVFLMEGMRLNIQYVHVPKTDCSIQMFSRSNQQLDDIWGKKKHIFM